MGLCCLILYDLPRGAPRWRLHRRLKRMRQLGEAEWERIQNSVIMCPSLRDAAKIAKTILDFADTLQDRDGLKLKVFVIATEVNLREAVSIAKRLEELHRGGR